MMQERLTKLEAASDRNRSTSAWTRSGEKSTNYATNYL
jgi:hypothetical protein